MSIALISIVFVILFLLSGLFSGSEIALFSLNRAAVNKLRREGKGGAKAVVKLKEKPHRLLVTILIGNNIVNIYAAALATALTISLFGSNGVGIATGVVTFLILLLGEIFPKALAHAYAAQIALVVSRPLLWLSYLLWPVVLVLEWLSKTMVHVISGGKEEVLGIEEEIDSLLHLGLEEGSTELFEHDFIQRLFRFDDTLVQEIMIPYVEAVLVDGDAEIVQVAHFLAQSGYSRFPVYQGSRKNVIGMVHVKDVFKANNSENRKNSIRSIDRDAVTVAASDNLSDALNTLRVAHSHSALVSDDSGEIVGFVTMEDMLERLIGDIQDEFDRGKNRPATEEGE
jgi:CBS domain containing-hemolysin-like protein